MKKRITIIPLTLLFVSLPTMANSSVELYGILDAGISHKRLTIKENNQKTRLTKTGFQDNVKNSSRWGLRGKEAITAHTNAIFQLEGGFTVSQGQSTQGGRLFGRQAIIGLEGPLGRLAFGRQDNLADDFVGIMDPFGVGWEQAAVAHTFGDAISTRYDSSIKYHTPSLNGLKIGVMATAHIRNEQQQDNFTKKEKSNIFSAAAYYEIDRFQIGTSYTNTYHSKRSEQLKAITQERTNANAWNIGATYVLYGLRYHAMYGQQHDGLIDNSPGLIRHLFERAFTDTGLVYGKGLRQRAWLLGLSYQIQPHSEILFSYQQGQLKNPRVFDGKGKTTIYSAAYVYNLSKRTSLYTSASYGHGKLDHTSSNSNKLKLNSQEITLGLNHRF